MYVFMDIEATGQVQSEAFQVAMVITNQKFEVKEMLNFYVEHEESINPYVLELCGLDESCLKKISEIAYTRSEAVKIVNSVFQKYSREDKDIIFVGKMIKGDIKWLRKIGVYCNQINFMEDSKYIELNHFLEGNHKLAEDCLEYGIKQEDLIQEVQKLLQKDKFTYGTQELLGGGYHNALVDAYAVYRILGKIISGHHIELSSYVQQYDWTNRSYLMMNRKAMEDRISVKIYQNQLLKEIKEEYGIEISQDKLMKVESIMFDNGCLMGVTKKEILLYFYLSEIKKSKRSCFNRYEVRVRRKKYIRRLDIVALNRYDLFIQLSKMISPQHIPQSFEKRSVILGLLNNPVSYLEANGYTLLSIKLKEENIEFKQIS